MDLYTIENIHYLQIELLFKISYNEFKYKQEVEQMATISLTRDIKLTNEDALKILNHKPSKKLQAVLKSIESQDATAPTKNKLISKYL